jgi:hypothetical protein
MILNDCGFVPVPSATLTTRRSVPEPRHRRRALLIESAVSHLATVAALAVVMILFASPAFAQKKANVTFKGELLNSFNATACNTSIYNSKCPSGACRCELYVVDPDKKKEKATGTLLGKVTMAEMDFTFSGGSDFVGSGPGSCQPFFASAFLTGAKDVEQLDMTGALCESNNSSKPKWSIVGGFGIASSSSGHEGFGTLSGTLNGNTGALSLSFKGTAN